MPKLAPNAEAVDVWFEGGMILFEDPNDPSQVCRCTVEDFEEKIAGLTELVEIYEERHKENPDARIVYCNKRDWQRFLNEVFELLREARQQIHVGLPLAIIAEDAASRRPISAQMGIGEGKFTKSGLWVPE